MTDGSCSFESQDWTAKRLVCHVNPPTGYVLDPVVLEQLDVDQEKYIPYLEYAYTYQNPPRGGEWTPLNS